jgi:hypothetical protein
MIHMKSFSKPYLVYKRAGPRCDIVAFIAEYRKILEQSPLAKDRPWRLVIYSGTENTRTVYDIQTGKIVAEPKNAKAAHSIQENHRLARP